jgi:hypothetical protein
VVFCSEPRSANDPLSRPHFSCQQILKPIGTAVFQIQPVSKSHYKLSLHPPQLLAALLRLVATTLISCMGGEMVLEA